MIGTIKIKIECLNSSKIINTLVDNGVFLKNLKERYKYIVFEIDERDEEKFRMICKKHHKHFDVISKNNIFRLVKKSRFYFGFCVALSLVVSFVYCFNLFVFQVNVSASSDVFFDLSKVNQLLIDNGIVSGMKKSELNISKLQNLIISSQDNISGCSVQRNGGKIDIVVYPGILKDQVSKENIYSKFNAVISSVELFAGKSDLKSGDLVKKGDLLIENDNGASGIITAKVYYSDYIIYNENQIVKEFTGREIEKEEIYLFNKKLFKTSKNIDFLNYTEENCVFCVSKNTFVSVVVKKITYKEFEYKEKIKKFENVEEILKEKLYSLVLEKIDEENKDKITTVTYSVVKENNLTRLDCFIECEINIAS